MVENLDIRANDVLQWGLEALSITRNITLKKSLTLLPRDASIRSYYRLIIDNKSYIVMHAPPEYTKNRAFVSIAQYWLSKGLRTPIIFAADIEKGFLLLEDFGHYTLFDTLNEKRDQVFFYYKNAMSILHRIQTLQPSEYTPFPVFDAKVMLREMQLFRQWVIDSLLHLKFSLSFNKTIDSIFLMIVECALSQPYTLMHRDFHSKNLMTLPSNHLGLLDFQDAVKGPVTYDIVSLLRDCYLDWPQSQVYQWLDQFANQIVTLKSVSKYQLYQYFDWMGLQRHLKVSGIFIRQWLQNNNTFYLQYLPRVFEYIRYVTTRYSQLTLLNELIENKVLPRLIQQSWWQQYQLMD